MTLSTGMLHSEEFLRDYWQKKPLLIRRAFPDFNPELDANDIAGLACDELAESRLVRGGFPEHDWSLEYGPFDEETLRSLPEERWTLLVQDVEKHYPPLRALFAHFDFLPSWRIDDLMVSVAAPGGSVGPHVDQYDVFLLQATGKRCWQIAENTNTALLPDTELNVLKSFEPEQEWILEPGDMLYLPPGVPHHGVALDSGMTWSIGMRAPSTSDLLLGLGEWLADARGEGRRYTDPDLETGEGSEISAAAIDRFAAMMHACTEDRDDFSAFLGCFLSGYRLAHTPAAPERPVAPETVASLLAQTGALRQHPWTRLIWTAGEPGQATLFAAGQAYSCSRDFAATVCDPARLENEAPALAAKDPALLADLLNSGHLYMETSS
jgi:50S ribosomal protein L16 3-hydroxylase